MGTFLWRPYVPVAVRQRQAAREMSRLSQNGHKVLPVRVAGREIAATFWGRAWCENLESYSDYDNRLPRGRTYVRNGSVIDLQIKPAKVQALVSGSEIYKVSALIRPLAPARWKALVRECSGKIGSLVELLQGRVSSSVLQVLARRKKGMFPEPPEMSFSCSCPDWADMCKHVAAALYGVGARLDEKPELFFTLRKVDQADLVSRAGSAVPRALSANGKGKRRLAASRLEGVFGIELDGRAGKRRKALVRSARRPRG